MSYDERRYSLSAVTSAVVAAFLIGMIVGSAVTLGGLFAGMTVAHHQDKP